MVHLALQQTVSELTVAEKVELRDCLDISLGSRAPHLTERQIADVRARAAELDADPTLALPWDDLNAELTAEFG